MNSTQVFNGMPPVKMSVTALFRAWQDPVEEVESPFDKLMEWSLPVELSKDSSMLARPLKAASGELAWLDVLMPSASPICIAMTYKKRTYSPLVIESIGMPMSSPIDESGRYVELSVPMTLCTLAALDRNDWNNTKVQSLL